MCIVHVSLTMMQMPKPLTEHVHKALLAIAAEIGIPEPLLKSRSRREKPASLYPSLLPESEWRHMADCLLAGFEFNLSEILINYKLLKINFSTREDDDLRRQKELVQIMVNALQLDHKWIQGMTPTTLCTFLKWGDQERKGSRFHLVNNANSLEWCKALWDELVATGAQPKSVIQTFITTLSACMYFHQPYRPFPSKWSALGTLRTLDELKVMQLSGVIRQKPDWTRKLQDETIVAKWRDEALSAQDATPSMFDFLIEELKWYAGELDEETGIDHAAVHGVFFSDTLISNEDRRIFRKAISEFENGLPFKDWHPGSNEQVLDLVHPSLYHYVRNRTPRFIYKVERPSVDPGLDQRDRLALLVMHDFTEPNKPIHPCSPLQSLSLFGQGTPTSSVSCHDLYEAKWGSSEYQWLPVDVAVSSSTPWTVEFLSYINNLHPAPLTPSGSLYPLLASILAKFLPLFERTLTNTRRKRLGTGALGCRPEFLTETNKWESYWDIPQPTSDYTSNDEGGYTREEYKQDVKAYYATRKFLRPTIRPYVPPEAPGEAQVSFAGKTIQVIVKLANIYLTPEKPEYKGGSWHVEGLDTEHIVATGIYYFESENISDPTLSFRQAADELPYEQYEWDYLQYLYGMNQGQDQTSQFLGSVETLDCRCICFPNGMQHRLSEFKLRDSSKPGHRKILVFFLVDPSTRILSTSDVPPQRFDWFVHEVRIMLAPTRFGNLPTEIQDQIFMHLKSSIQDDWLHDANGKHPTVKNNWLMTYEEANVHRANLMKERSVFAQTVDESLYERTYNFCEH